MTEATTKTVGAAPADETPTIHILWINAGLSCDGDSVALTAAMQPSIEEIVISVVGAALLAVIFAASAAQQRADLQRFLEQTFSEVPRLLRETTIVFFTRRNVPKPFL